MGKSLDIIDLKKDLRTPEQDDSEEKFEQRGESGGGGLFYLILGIVALVVAIAIALYVLYKDSNPVDTENQSPTVTATTSISPITSITAVTSPVVLTSPTSQTAFKYTDESIRIANGNSINGEANKIKAQLEAAGFKVASVGNASRAYTESTIYYKTGEEALAKALQSAIKDNYAATTKEDNPVVGSYDAVVVLGSK